MGGCSNRPDRSSNPNNTNNSSGPSGPREPLTSATAKDVDPRRGDDERDNNFVRFLEGMARKRWSTRSYDRHLREHAHISFDAATTVSFVMRYSLAARAPKSHKVLQFAEQFNKDMRLDMDRISYSNILTMVDEWFRRIDDVFFLCLLDSFTKGLTGITQQMIKLVPHKGFKNRNPYFRGLYRPRSKYNRDAIFISITYEDGWLPRHRPFGALLTTLVHEMCHAYIRIFSDRRSREYEEWVNQKGGHGTMFWKLNRWISFTIISLTQSEVYWEYIPKEVDYRDYCPSSVEEEEEEEVGT
ncbi:hypothetical protein F4808DRAFT_413154 [Astrocystis sublimbata]|nr:hypothetical protein F4808DRAFT_413154 [Astrocystis sublimbata]